MTRGQSIAAKCRQCTHDPHSPGTWREQVAQCSVIACPLWAFRPAPAGGPFANPPRDPETVTPEWRRAPVGRAFSAIGGPIASNPPPRHPPQADHGMAAQITANHSELMV